MKKHICFLLVLIITLFCFCGCNGEKSTQSKSNDTTTTEKETSHNKISGEITAASDFSEGLAFVCLDENKEKTYCINKNGEIVFELDKNWSVSGNIYEKFHNGYTLIDDAFCNTKGKLTYPKDVGATKFSLLAIKDGYIIAEVKNSTYNSTDFKIGVMDTSFNWTLEPSSEIGGKLNGLPFETTRTYCENGIVCFDVDEYGYDYKFLYLNIKTGEISETTSNSLPSEKWLPCSNGYGLCEYRDYNEKVVLDLSANYNNIYDLTAFVKGKAAILLLNEGSQEYFYTIINEKGEFQFEPINCGQGLKDVKYDGEYALLEYEDFNGTTVCENAKCYSNDKLMCDIKRTDPNTTFTYSLSDGVIKISAGTKKHYFYSPNGEKLF